MDTIDELIKNEGRPKKRAGKLGEIYQYDLLNKPFLGSEKKVGSKYLVPLINASGQTKVLTADSLNDLENQFAQAHADGWNETTTTNDWIAANEKEDKGAAHSGTSATSPTPVRSRRASTTRWQRHRRPRRIREHRHRPPRSRPTPTQ